MLSKKGKEAVKLLKKIRKDVEQYGELYDALEGKEKLLVGALLVGCFSIGGETGYCSVIGQETLARGVLAQLVDAMKEDNNPLAGLLGKLN